MLKKDKSLKYYKINFDKDYSNVENEYFKQKMDKNNKMEAYMKTSSTNFTNYSTSNSHKKLNISNKENEFTKFSNKEILKALKPQTCTEVKINNELIVKKLKKPFSIVQKKVKLY